ncbi:hypothetical protein [Mastigocoleus testarum]|uniref:Uncharacterized protein n=1 Tax=Mastigocoleus testarum BC008 TaxID=371196 RepID=A0A0V7ZL37_9CYAN|nr:hypothetical protein [Mastigocoleus testarum]KST65251.1 hypothetical protein BC008_20890 [Mastigocoleus testarum BC008]
MSALQISQLAPVNALNELDVLDQESVNGGFFLSLSYSGGTKLTRITELKNVFSGGNPPNLKNQVVATGGSTVVIDSSIPLPG